MYTMVIIGMLLLFQIQVSISTTYFMKDSYVNPGPIHRLTNNYQITTIDIQPVMTFSFDILIIEFPLGNNQHKNILHVGNENGERFPAIWLYDNIKGFHICMTTIINDQCYDVQIEGNLQIQTVYNVKIEYTQSSFIVSIDDKKYIELTDYPKHELLTDRSVFIGDPWYDIANFQMENFKIQLPADLCCAYLSPDVYGCCDIPLYSEGHIFSYQGARNDRPYWKLVVDRGNYFVIYWDPSDSSWKFGVETRLDDPDGPLHFWANRAINEVDALYGAQWLHPMLLSSKICGIPADTNPVQETPPNLIPPTYINYIYALILIILIIITFINMFACFRVRAGNIDKQ